MLQYDCSSWFWYRVHVIVLDLCQACSVDMFGSRLNAAGRVGHMQPKRRSCHKPPFHACIRSSNLLLCSYLCCWFAVQPALLLDDLCLMFCFLGWFVLVQGSRYCCTCLVHSDYCLRSAARTGCSWVFAVIVVVRQRLRAFFSAGISWAAHESACGGVCRLLWGLWCWFQSKFVVVFERLVP